MTTVANPLVAARQDSTTWYTGVGIVESIADTRAGIESGSWIDSSIGGVAASLETLNVVVDPLGALMSWGVGWLLEHVKPLSDAVDWLAGDPDQITAYAQTWRNVSANATSTADGLRASVDRELAEWSGAAASAYRAHIGAHLTAMGGIAEAADTLGVLVEGAGLLVALVRELVRDLIADFVSVLAVRLPTWLAEEGFTFGAATPLVAAQVSTLVAKWGGKISELVLKLLDSLRRLIPAARHLDELIGLLKDRLSGLGRRGDYDSPASPGSPDVDGPGGGESPWQPSDHDDWPDDFDLPDIPPPIRDGPTLPTGGMADEYRFETDPDDPRNPFRPNGVRRLSPDELERRRVVVGPDGRFYTSSGDLFDTRSSNTIWGGATSTHAIFVMDEHGNLYASLSQKLGQFHHSTLGGGKPVAGAGEIHVEDGRIVQITDSSGHYRPTRAMTEQVVATLQEQGADLGGLDVQVIAPEGS